MSYENFHLVSNKNTEREDASIFKILQPVLLSQLDPLLSYHDLLFH